MKCFVLLVIFAIVQYQDVRGSGCIDCFSFFTEKEDPIQCTFTDLDQELENILRKFPKSNSFFRFISLYKKTKIYLRNLMKFKANFMNSFYKEALKNFTNDVAHIDQDIKNGINLFENGENWKIRLHRIEIPSDVTTQVNAVQTTSVPDKLDEFFNFE